MTKTQAKIAWILWKVLLQLDDLLWRRYEDQFLDFIMEEEDKKHINQPGNPQTHP